MKEQEIFEEWANMEKNIQKIEENPSWHLGIQSNSSKHVLLFRALPQNPIFW